MFVEQARAAAARGAPQADLAFILSRGLLDTFPVARARATTDLVPLCGLHTPAHARLQAA
jgi:hypothetical protein